jgi:hypothetical protein
VPMAVVIPMRVAMAMLIPMPAPVVVTVVMVVAVPVFTHREHRPRLARAAKPPSRHRSHCRY